MKENANPSLVKEYFRFSQNFTQRNQTRDGQVARKSTGSLHTNTIGSTQATSAGRAGSSGTSSSQVLGVSSRYGNGQKTNSNKENKPINATAVSIGQLQTLNKTLSVLEGRRANKNVAQQKIAQAQQY